MSEPRRASRHCRAGVVAAALLLASHQGFAQDRRAAADSLEQALRSAMRAFAEADSAVERAQAASRARQDRVLVAGGRRVRFASSELTPADTVALVEGLERAHLRLIREFGPGAAELPDRETWVVSRRRVRRGIAGAIRPTEARIALSERRFATSWDLRYPLRAGDVERMAIRLAADGLIEVAPALRRFRSSLVLEVSDDAWENAARELALSWAAAGRRCYLGVLGACEAVMTLRRDSASIPAWLDASDRPAAVVASQLRPNADSADVVDRRACVAGDGAACERVFPRVVVPDPFSAQLRATFVAHALGLGGAEALDRLRTAPDTTLLPLLAHAAGVTPDELLSGWQARVAGSLRSARSGLLAAGSATTAWCALLLLVAVRRRP